MKAPDKIYIQELSDGTWDDCFVYESSETDTNGKERVPYIRKEALLEWLNNEDKYPSFESCVSEKWEGYYAALDNVIDKINSM